MSNSLRRKSRKTENRAEGESESGGLGEESEDSMSGKEMTQDERKEQLSPFEYEDDETPSTYATTKR